MTDPVPASLSNGVVEFLRENELFARFIYEAIPESDKFAVSVLIGKLASAQLKYDEQQAGYVAKSVRAVRLGDVTQSYTDSRAGVGVVVNARMATTFAYNRDVLLRNLTSADQVEDAISTLCNRHELESAGNVWQRSVLGFETFITMQRGLFVASGASELDTPLQVVRILTDPEVRANVLNLAGSTAMDAYMNMRPSPE